MSAALAYLPDMAIRRERIDMAAQSIARADAVRRAKRVIDDPRGYSDEQLAEVCAAFMAMSPTREELADGWGVYYQRADLHLFAIRKRERIARNRAQCQAMLADMPKARAPRRGREVAAVLAGCLLALAVAVALHSAGVM
jgi:hypothetical protein